jgi:dTDP-4-dehydrorhamnose 3,5-epimerase-like enzyme
MFRFPEQVSPARGFCVEVVLEASDAVSESREKQVIVRRSRARGIVLRRHEEVRRQRAVFVLCEQRPRFVEWYHCRQGEEFRRLERAGIDDTAQLLAIGYSEAAPTILSDDVFCMNAAAPRWLADQEGSRSTRTSFSTAWVPSSSNAGSNFLTV